MSSLYKKGNRWFIQFFYKQQRFRKSLGIQCRHGNREVNRDIARKLQTQIDEDLLRGQFPAIFSETAAPQSKMLYEFMDEFLDYIKRQKRRYSFKSIEHYEWSFGVLRKIVHDMPLRDLDKRTISRIIFPYLFENYSPHSAHGVLKDMRAALNIAITWGYVDKNPFAGMVTKPPRTVPDFFEPAEIEQIRNYCNRPDIPQWQGDWIFLTLNTGLRKMEALQLRWQDVDLQNEVIRLTGKGNKTMYVPLNAAALHILQQRPRNDRNARVFWEIESKSALESAWRRLRQRTGISGGIHKLRKTYASYLAMREGNLRKLQERLRHDDIDTTMIYAGITQEALHEGKNKINFFREGGG